MISKLSPQSNQLLRLGGRPGISAADVSHACMHLDGIGYYLILSKYSSDLSGYEDLNLLLIDRIADEAKKEGWKKSRIPCLVHLSISEYTGAQKLKDKDRARILGVHPSVWLRVWKDKYKRLFEIMESYENEALRSVRGRLG